MLEPSCYNIQMFSTERLIELRRETYRGITYVVCDVDGLPNKVFAFTEASPYFHINEMKPFDVDVKAQKMIDNYLGPAKPEKVQEDSPKPEARKPRKRASTKRAKGS
jgi:hypothetical protein